MHREVEEPCRPKVAEHITGILEEALRPVIAPQLSSGGLASVYSSLGIIDPCLDVVIQNNLAVLHPRSGNIVGVYTIGIVNGRSHLVAGLCHLRGGLVVGCPILNSFLNVSRIIGAKNFLRDLTVVDQSGGAGLPGRSTDHAVRILDDILCVGVLLCKVILIDSQLSHGHRNIRILINILQSVVSLDQEDINLIVRRSVNIAGKNAVKVVLICVVIRRSDGPDNINITDLAVRLIDCFISRIMIRNTILELFVPDLDIQDLALIRSLCECSVRQNHCANQAKADQAHHTFLHSLLPPFCYMNDSELRSSISLCTIILQHPFEITKPFS